MAIYDSRSDNVKPGHGNAFNSTHRPGQTVPHSGIYSCEHCGDEQLMLVTHFHRRITINITLMLHQFCGVVWCLLSRSS